MAYQKHTWVTREVIRRDLLQNIEDGIYNEEQRAIEAESGLSSAISSEENRAKSKENQLNQSITDVASNLSTEVNRATAKETELETAISDETTRATAAESSLSDGISGVNTALSAEITRASGAEGTLRTDLNAEITRAQGAEGTLTTNLASEVSRATAAESALQTYVDQKLTTLYKPDGSVYFSALPALSLQRLDYVYNVKDAFTTTADFTDGAGKSYPAGTNVAIISVDGDYYDEVTPVGTENPSEEGWYEYDSVDDEYELSEDTTVDSGKTYYTYSDSKLFYDCLSGFVDLSNYVEKTDKATPSQLGLVKPDGTTITIDGDGTIHSVGGGQGSAEAAERMIAPIEPDATASIRAYTVGQRLILNELLYEAIAAIAIGDALIAYEDDPTNANIKLAPAITDFDTTPTQNSTKFVTSGGVYDFLETQLAAVISAAY